MKLLDQRDHDAVVEAVKAMAAEAEQCLAIASKSPSETTRASHLNIASDLARRLKEISAEFPFVRLTQIGQFEAAIATARQIRGDAPDSNVYYPISDYDQSLLALGLAEQCTALDLPLEQLPMVRRNRRWIVGDQEFAKPEDAALAHFAAQGYFGFAHEGGPVLTLMKAACLPYLESIERLGANAARCRFFEAHCRLNLHRKHRVLDAISASTADGIVAANRLIREAYGPRPPFPPLNEDTLISLWRAITPSRLAQLASYLFLDFGYRAGWPDLVLVQENDVRFVEVKTTDKLHLSQILTIRDVLQSCGLSVSVIQLSASRT